MPKVNQVTPKRVVSGKRPAGRAPADKSARMKLLEQMPTNGISNATLRVLALQAGLNKLSSGAKRELREIVHEVMQNVLRAAFDEANYSRKLTIHEDMVLHGYKLSTGRSMYIGFDGPSPSSSDVHKCIKKILRSGAKKRAAEASAEEAVKPAVPASPKKAPASPKKVASKVALAGERSKAGKKLSPKTPSTPMAAIKSDIL